MMFHSGSTVYRGLTLDLTGAASGSHVTMRNALRGLRSNDVLGTVYLRLPDLEDAQCVK